MKKLALITIGILISLSSFSQMFEVEKQIINKDGQETTYDAENFNLTVTRVDSKFNGRGKVRLVLFNDHKHTKMVLKCDVVDKYYKEGKDFGQVTFVLQHDIVGKIEFDTDEIGRQRTLYLEHNKDTDEFETLLVIKE